jgi:hypothetical protein
MILPPGETDKHMFDLEAAVKKLEAIKVQKLIIFFILSFLQSYFWPRYMNDLNAAASGLILLTRSTN